MLASFQGKGPTQSPSQMFSRQQREDVSRLLTKIDNELAMLRGNAPGVAAETIRQLERIVAELRVELIELSKGLILQPLLMAGMGGKLTLVEAPPNIRLAYWTTANERSHVRSLASVSPSRAKWGSRKT